MGNTEGCAIAASTGWINATSFETEIAYDFLVVGGTWFHGVFGPRGVAVSQGDIIDWYSDFSVVRKGWEICLNTTEPDQISTTEVSVTHGRCSVTDHCVSSPNFPSNYGDLSRCVITLPAGFLYSSSFQTESWWDFLFVGGETFSGTSGPYGFEVGAGTSIYWSTDESVTDKGWEICWEETERATVSQVTLTSGDCVVSDNCVRTPNYPLNYNDMSSCGVVTPSGYIYSNSFSSEFGYDLVTVGAASFSGGAGPYGVEVEAGDFIHWSADGEVSNSGWEICLEPVAREPVRELTVVRGHCEIRSTCVRSNNYPAEYDEYDCFILCPPGWIFATAFETETGYDVLYVNGNAYSGHFGPWGIELSTESVINWAPDNHTQHKGWEICHSETDTLVMMTTDTTSTVEEITTSEPHRPGETQTLPSWAPPVQSIEGVVLPSVAGTVHFAMDSTAQATLCSNNMDLREALVDGANAIVTLPFTVAQVVSAVVSPCDRRLVSGRILEVLSYSVDYELSLASVSEAAVASAELIGDFSSFASAFAMSLFNSLEITVSDVHMEVVPFSEDLVNTSNNFFVGVSSIPVHLRGSAGATISLCVLWFFL